MRRRGLLAICLLLTAGCGGAAPFEATEWNPVFQRSSGYGWSGGDAASSIPLPGARTLWLFGDSMLGDVTDGRRIHYEVRFGNTIAIQSHVAPSTIPRPEDFRFDWGPADSNGWLPLKPQVLEDPTAPPSAAVARAQNLLLLSWPLHGVTIGKDVVIFTMPVTPFSCTKCTFPFKVHGSTTTVIHGVDRPYEQWGVRPGAGWIPENAPSPVFVPHSRAAPALEDPTGLIWGTFVLPARDGTLYVYGSRQQGADISLVVARLDGVTRAEDVQDFARWRFWDGARWVSTADGAATIDAPGQVEGSISAIPDDEGGGYVFVHSGDFFSGKIELSVALAPWGPFTHRYELDLADCPVEGFDPAARMLTYAAKAHPELSDADSLLISFVTRPVGEQAVGDSLDQRFYTPRFLHVPWREILNESHSSADRCRALAD